MHEFVHPGRAVGRSLALAGAIGCASGVSYSGQIAPRQIESRGLRAGERPPAGHERLGEVAARCTPWSGEGEMRGVRLSSVSCSIPFLRAAIVDRSLSVGGTFLVGLDCDPPSTAVGRELSCEAEVWWPAQPSSTLASEPEPLPLNVDPEGPAAPGGPPIGKTPEAWHVRLDFHPGQAASERVQRLEIAPSEVHEVAVARMHEVTVGDLVAYCESGHRCHRSSVRTALRAGAARLGGSAIVGVRCNTESGATRCIAGVGVPRSLAAEAG